LHSFERRGAIWFIDAVLSAIGDIQLNRRRVNTLSRNKSIDFAQMITVVTNGSAKLTMNPPTGREADGTIFKLHNS